jgi:hypothetical protein
MDPTDYLDQDPGDPRNPGAGRFYISRCISHLDRSFVLNNNNNLFKDFYLVTIANFVYNTLCPAPYLTPLSNPIVHKVTASTRRVNLGS